MNEFVQGDFLRQRMIELREKSGKSLSDMAVLLNCNKSTLSRVESGSSGYKTIYTYAQDYCKVLNLTDLQTAQFLRGVRVVVTDTSALLKNTVLIEELSKEYSYVIVPDIVVDELDHIKDHDPNLNKRAWQILKTIGASKNVITRPYTGGEENVNNDARIIAVARAAAEEFKCVVDIITYDAGFSARLSGDETVKALFLEEYLITKQNLVDMNSIKAIDSYYADSYEDIENVLGIRIPSREDINAYLSNGYTLIISAVRNKRFPISQRIEKIRWLISHGADVDKRDCEKYYLPPLSHAIQMNNLEIFRFLLHECKANPNRGSRNPHDAGKIRQKNDGNMPLMIAAWDGKTDFVKELLADERTSINQQDGNGFTALIKACYWGWLTCRDLLIEAGADQKIVDRDGYTAEDRYRECLELDRRKSNDYRRNNQRNQKNNYRGYRR